MEEVKKCSQCKREIYDAKICPFCGNIIEDKNQLNDNNKTIDDNLLHNKYQKNKTKKTKYWGIIIVILVVIIYIFMIIENFRTMPG